MEIQHGISNFPNYPQIMRKKKDKSNGLEGRGKQGGQNKDTKMAVVTGSVVHEGEEALICGERGHGDVA